MLTFKEAHAMRDSNPICATPVNPTFVLAHNPFRSELLIQLSLQRIPELHPTRFILVGLGMEVDA